MGQHISVIIPILNEETYISKLITHILKYSTKRNIAEIIVVDGGSTDQSKSIVSKFNLVLLLNSEKGRAKQMNVGAKQATGEILYFLHADALPPKHFDEHILDEVKKGNKAGCFRMQFNSTHWWLRLASWLTQFSWRACRGGDQSLFITKKLFNSIGGYDEFFTIYEDIILINELYNRNQFVVIPQKIYTSARSYKRNGIWTLQYHYWTIYVKRWFGASAEKLFVYYKKHIK